MILFNTVKGNTLKQETNTNLAVEVKGLVKTFGDNKAVDGVDLNVPTGSIYGLLGPNGAGKSTVLNMLATLMKPDGGSAKIFGHDVASEPQIIRQLIGVTGQDTTVDESLSATENLIIFGRLLGLSKSDAKKKAAELLEEFSLTEAAKRPLSKFSGGMRRRLDLAASLIVQPPLIFLDEPTTGLDPRTRNQMWDTIRALVSKGSTILLTTQYLDEADQLADRIAVIDNGRVIAEGTPKELKAMAGVTTLQLHLAEGENTAEAERIIQSALKVKVISPEPLHITAPMADPERITDLLIALRKENIRLVEVSVQKPTLDEVFLIITGDEKQTKVEGVIK
ncbi:MAG TPA: ATP-binding cassette domain-containing protein [Candidatus Saccharimonadales bacterium]|nr:ATP-binding cassette domain-containing protein [Candidatus Saccharimonadales bacterium]